MFLSQGAELTLCHLAGYRMGAIVLPLFTLFGEEALEYRLANAEASAIVTDMSQLPKVLAVRDRLPHLKTIDRDRRRRARPRTSSTGTVCWPRPPTASPRSTRAAEDPALLIYTSGTTGQPKGALHAHRMMLGSIPPVEQWLSHWPSGNEVMWTPAEWAWIAGLYDALFPAWYLRHAGAGASLRQVRSRARLRAAGQAPGRRQLHPADRAQDDAAGAASRASAGTTTLRAVFTGGEAMGEELLAWGRDTFGTTISEGYGQTEMNLMLLNSPDWFEVRPGSCGRACPGRKVAIVDGDGNVLPPGEEGQIAGWRHDPIVMLEYWRNPEATAKQVSPATGC